MRRSKAEQRTIVPSEVARIYSTAIIARYGILNAADIARCVGEQVQAAINQQKRLHPEEWRLTPAESEKKPLSMPKVGK